MPKVKEKRPCESDDSVQLPPIKFRPEEDTASDCSTAPSHRTLPDSTDDEEWTPVTSRRQSRRSAHQPQGPQSAPRHVDDSRPSTHHARSPARSPADTRPDLGQRRPALDPQLTAARPSVPRHPAPSRPSTSAQQQPVPRVQPQDASSHPVPKVLIPPTEGFETALDLAEALEEELGKRLPMRFLETGCVLVSPDSEETLQTLLATTHVLEKPVSLRQAAENTTKGVVMAYPVAMPLKPLLRHPNILTAERCRTRDGTETRQVVITMTGQLPGTLDLGSWGTFSTRPFSKEPLRCFNCQQFGHHRARCNRPPLCGMCSGPHATESCLSKYKAGMEVPAKCPNCNDAHHAWSRRCPKRRILVDQEITRQEVWVATHNPSRPAWTRRSRSRPSAAAPTSTALASEDHFPSLPQATAPRASSTTHRQQQQRKTAPPASNPRPKTAPILASDPPPGHVLVTKAALEGMLTSFALALSSLLQVSTERKAIQAIAKATVEEHFPTLTHTPAAPPNPSLAVASHQSSQPAAAQPTPTQPFPLHPPQPTAALHLPQTATALLVPTPPPPHHPSHHPGPRQLSQAVTAPATSSNPLPTEGPMEVTSTPRPLTPGLTPATTAIEEEKRALGLLGPVKTPPPSVLPTRSRLPVALRKVVKPRLTQPGRQRTAPLTHSSPPQRQNK